MKSKHIKKVQIIKPGDLNAENQSTSIKIERLFDRHNHKMEFLRTLFAMITVSLQIVILGKLFGIF